MYTEKKKKRTAKPRIRLYKCFVYFPHNTNNNKIKINKTHKKRKNN